MNDRFNREPFSSFAASLAEEPCEVAIILGSGLGSLTEDLERPRIIPYDEIPGFPPISVSGHGGQLVVGELVGRRVAIFQGRFHLYEGHDARQATVTVRLGHALGCRRLLLTCAAGGIRRDFRPGDVMFVSDHLNLMGDNPLRGAGGDPFVDLSTLYCLSLLKPLADHAARESIRLHGGVLAAVPGPSYETPAEVRMLERMGADAVSMSTVPEAIMGKFLGMEVAALAFISNAAAGLSDTALDHREVLEQGRLNGPRFRSLARALLRGWRESSES